MPRFRLALCLFLIAVGGLLLPLRSSHASVVTKTLAQTPVTGRLADGRPFHGQLTVHALTVAEDGQLTAAGVLSGTVGTTPGAETPIPARPCTAPAALLDLRGTCTTLILDVAPIVVAPIAAEVTLMPIILRPPGTGQQDVLLRTTLCTVARLQDESLQ